MTGSFGIDVLLHLEDLAAVLTALRQLAKPPGWLVAIEDTGRVRKEFEQAVPELGAGAPALVKVKFKRAHLEDGHWVTLHRLTVLDEGADSPREIDIRGVCSHRASRRRPRPSVARPSSPPSGGRTCPTFVWWSTGSRPMSGCPPCRAWPIPRPRGTRCRARCEAVHPPGPS